VFTYQTRPTMRSACSREALMQNNAGASPAQAPAASATVWGRRRLMSAAKSFVIVRGKRSRSNDATLSRRRIALFPTPHAKKWWAVLVVVSGW
jgi:hypothetical protein